MSPEEVSHLLPLHLHYELHERSRRAAPVADVDGLDLVELDLALASGGAAFAALDKGQPILLLREVLAEEAGGDRWIACVQPIDELVDKVADECDLSPDLRWDLLGSIGPPLPLRGRGVFEAARATTSTD